MVDAGIPEFVDREVSCEVRAGIIYPPRTGAEEERRFLSEYRAIRKREGRGELRPDDYLRLPWGGFSPERREEWEERGRSLGWLLGRYGDRLPSMRVLDAGAGNCWLSYRLLEQGAEVVALDIDDSDYDGLGRGDNVTGAGVAAGKFYRVVASFSSTPFLPGTFDLVVYNASLHYADEPGAVIAEGLRLLRTGGEIVVMDSPVYRNRSSGDRMVKERGGPERAGFLTEAQLEEVAVRFRLDTELIPRTRGLLPRIRRLLHRIRLRREPARMPWIILRPKEGGSRGATIS